MPILDIFFFCNFQLYDFCFFPSVFFLLYCNVELNYGKKIRNYSIFFFGVHDVRAQYDYKMKFLNDCVLLNLTVFPFTILSLTLSPFIHTYAIHTPKNTVTRIHFIFRPRFASAVCRERFSGGGCYCMSEKMNVWMCVFFLPSSSSSSLLLYMYIHFQPYATILE